MSVAPAREPRRAPDRRWRTLALVVATISLGGLLASGAPRGGWLDLPWKKPQESPDANSRMADPARREIHQRFQQGVIMLHAKQHEHAMTAFHRVLQLDPAMPEAHVDMGFALIGLERHAAARSFFESAIALRREQANAYYGLALALEGLRDRAGAIGAMRTFVHLSAPDAPYVRKARAVLREWQAE